MKSRELSVVWKVRTDKEPDKSPINKKEDT